MLAGLTRRKLGEYALMAGAMAMSPLRTLSAASAPIGTSDVKRWRADFPALNQQIDGHPLTYLDSAATTQRPTAVLEALMSFYRHDNANPGSALHSLARRAYEQYEGARRTLATFLNAAEPEEVVWTKGTTEGINLVATAWARSVLHHGDELLLTVAEHASNLLPWRLVAEQTGATVRYLDVDDDGRVLLEDLERKLSQNTRLVAFSHVSNVAGYINPAAQICTRARRAGARVLIDAAQTAPHIPLDVQAMGCDFLAFSSHKMLGPMGVGVLWARRELLDAMPPYQAGSNMAHQIDLTSQEFEHGARKFGAGTPNVAGPVGLAAAVRYMNSLGRNTIERHEARLTQYALERLADIPGLRLLGPKVSSERLPVFSFVLAERTPQETLRHLDAQGIAVRAGDLASLPLLKRFGVSSALRASCYLYTQPEDIERLAGALNDLMGAGRA
jgi:cysteine desulfurase/selenocysteine lyase